jgi:hypothetical protein
MSEMALTILPAFVFLMRVNLHIEKDDETHGVDPLYAPMYWPPYSSSSKKIPMFHPEKHLSVIEFACIFSFVWGFGGLLSGKDRELFDHFFKKLVSSFQIQHSFPQETTVSHYYPNFSALK